MSFGQTEPPEGSSHSHTPGARRTPAPAERLLSATADLTKAAQSAAPLEPLDRTEGGAGTHLPPAARGLILAAIVRGDSNGQINAALVRAGYLPRGKLLAPSTYTAYRQSQEARVEIARLSEEAVQAGHVALSETIVVASESFRACYDALFEAGGKHRQMPLAERNALVREMYLAVNHLVRCLWREELVTNALRQMEEEERGEEASRRSRLSPEDKKAFEISIKRQLLEIIRRGNAGQQTEQVTDQTADQTIETTTETIEAAAAAASRLSLPPVSPAPTATDQH